MPAPTANAAVFLSYSRDDLEAVRRIADGLRAAGVEVWFDQNELVGGDAWDQKIRQQVRECALFVPVISAHTQARREGYFRLEWHLAEERMRQIAKGTPFLVPVVIDDTAERDAIAPDAFLAVQWTRLPGGETSLAFVARVQMLLGAKGESSGSAAGARLVRAQEDGRGPATPLRRTSWTWPVVAILAIGVAAFFLARKSEPPAAPPKSVVETKTVSAPPASNLPPPTSPAPLAPAKSIAVLPFANMSPDKDNEFFADGVHEDVITNLAKIRDLKVISRTSVLAYRDTASRNLKKIASELGVATVLEGSVRRVGTKVRVTAQLIDARTDEHLWAETFDRDLTDVFTIQSALAQEIASALKANFTVGERALVGTRLTQDPEAYEIYLRARALAENSNINAGASSRDLIERIIALHGQAIAKDPAFSAAYAQVAYLHGRMYWYESLDPSPARREQAKSALDAAVRIAPNQPETRLALGAYAYYCDNDWPRALVEFRAAEAGLPNNAQINYFLALTERRLGQFSEAVQHFNRSLELNPRDRLCYDQLLQTLAPLRRYAAWRDVAARALAIFPDADNFMTSAAAAQVELDHDRAAYLRAVEAIPLPTDAANNARVRYNRALQTGNFAAAESVAADPKLKTLPAMGALINDPIERHRAMIAFLRGDRDAARKFAEEAIKYYQTHPWAPRQAGAVKIGIALSEALAGRGEEAVKLAHEAYEWQLARDVFSARQFLDVMAQIYSVLDRPEDVLNTLREMMREATMGPEQARRSPIFSKVKNDPRFEEILKLAKPL